MALTREFSDTVKARAERDSAFREALLIEALELLIAGDVDTGKAVLRQFINATTSFEALARGINMPAKSLVRMFSAEGNPRVDRFFAVISHLQHATGVHLAVGVNRSDVNRPVANT